MHRRRHKLSAKRLTHHKSDPGVQPEQPSGMPLASRKVALPQAADEQSEITLLDLPRVQAALGISRSAVFELLRAGQLPARKIGRRTLVTAADLERFVAELQPAEYRPLTPKASRPRGYGHD